jgi:LacI family repressor for deo operon, udp, cdd, tsx, nupC, and nupG
MDNDFRPDDPAAGARGVRIRDVAAAAGVSTATVSRTLSNPESVRPETRERVLKVVRKLEYTPNEAARTLRVGAARMVMVAVPHLYSGAFFAGVINAIETELSAAGYTMIMGSLDSEKARRLIELVYARQIDGVIILGNCAGQLGQRSVLDAGVPVVAISAELDRPGQPSVLIDDRACAIMQTRHLLDLGHRRLLYVSGMEAHYNEIHRYRGFREATAAAGLAAEDVQRVSGGYTLSSGVAAGRWFLGQERRATGVVCCSDETAIGFLRTVTDSGVRVPQDVSIVGFDDIEFAQFCQPPLTTVHQPRDALGASGARILIRWLSGEPPQGDSSVVVDGVLKVRNSTGPAPLL